VATLASEFEVECPCCGGTLVVDSNLRRVISHQEAQRQDTPSLEAAQQILADEKSRRDALFARSVADEKGRGDVLSKRFDEALQRAKDEPIERPVRDFDLD
jgi:hypothetical protein